MGTEARLSETSSRPVVQLRVPGTRRHLSFFRKMVLKPGVFIQAGAVVDVKDRSGAHIGAAFYNPKSEVALRMLGEVEDDFVENRIKKAIAFRDALAIDSDAYRICHAEGDGLPGLVIDRYAGVHVIEIFTLGMLLMLERIRSLFPKVHVRSDARTQELEGFRLPKQEVPEGVVIREHGTQYRIDFQSGHKTGFFCDQRENRRVLAGLAKGKDVLDLCTYTGGFAVAAARAGAERVTAVDMDEKALEIARQNARLNRVKIDFLHADLFNYLKQVKKKFDIVILDPPKMAQGQVDIPKAQRVYFDMNRLPARVVKPGGILVSCSCTGLVNEQDFLTIVRNAAEREIRMFRIAGAGPDHPFSSLFPEGRYLKVVFSRVP